MLYDLYQVLEGNIKRKNINGLRERYTKGYKFVPTPGELNFIKTIPSRAVKIGTVAADAPEVKLMKLNLNTADYPEGRTVQAKAVSDIREIKATQDAVLYVATVATEDELDNFLIQESDNKPRVRKAVLNAIEKRREELAKKNSLDTQLSTDANGE